MLFALPCWIYPTFYQEEVLAASHEFDVPASLLYAVIKTESGFRKNAVSKKGAVGLMQILPSTYEELAPKLSLDENSHLFSPAVNIRVGAYYLSWLYQRYLSWDIALAAYNAGPRNVAKWLEEDKTLSRIPYPETEQYVWRVQRARGEYERLYRTLF